MCGLLGFTPTYLYLIIIGYFRDRIRQQTNKMKIMQQKSSLKFNYKNSHQKKKFFFFSKPVKASFFNMLQHTGEK